MGDLQVQVFHDIFIYLMTHLFISVYIYLFNYGSLHPPTETSAALWLDVSTDQLGAVAHLDIFKSTK